MDTEKYLKAIVHLFPLPSNRTVYIYKKYDYDRIGGYKEVKKGLQYRKWRNENTMLYLFLIRIYNYEPDIYQMIFDIFMLLKYEFISYRSEFFRERVCHDFFNNVKHIVIPNNIYELTNNFFERSRLESIILNKGLTRIGLNAFRYTLLKEIIIPKSVKSIDIACFERCENLEKVTFEKGSNVTVISSCLFNFCIMLKEVILPSKLKYIYCKAFSSCLSLTNLNLPKTVKSISPDAFRSTPIESRIKSSGLISREPQRNIISFPRYH